MKAIMNIYILKQSKQTKLNHLPKKRDNNKTHKEKGNMKELREKLVLKYSEIKMGRKLKN